MAVTCEKVTILLIDRDEAFRSALSTILREDGHEVIEYDDPRHVPPLNELGAVDLAISDCSDGERQVLAFAADFHMAWPEVPLILLTAYADGYRGRSWQVPHLHVLPKPVDYESFHARLHEIVG